MSQLSTQPDLEAQLGTVAAGSDPTGWLLIKWWRLTDDPAYASAGFISVMGRRMAHVKVDDDRNLIINEPHGGVQTIAREALIALSFIPSQAPLSDEQLQRFLNSPDVA